MERIAVSSENIASVGYDASTGTLEIEFRKGGTVYQYFDVPQQVFDDLMAAPSHGSFLAARIKGSYQYVKL